MNERGRDSHASIVKANKDGRGPERTKSGSAWLARLTVRRKFWQVPVVPVRRDGRKQRINLDYSRDSGMRLPVSA
jgi:hypothetical protein